MASTDVITFPSKTHTHKSRRYDIKSLITSTVSLVNEGTAFLYIFPDLHLYTIHTVLQLPKGSFSIFSNLPIIPQDDLNVPFDCINTTDGFGTIHYALVYLNFGKDQGSTITTNVTTSTTVHLALRYTARYIKDNTSSPVYNKYTEL